MGLKDTLLSLASKPDGLGYCKFGAIFINQDKELQDALTEVLRSGASTLDITRALNNDGISIRREFVGEKRRCFKDPNIICCLGDKRPAFEAEEK
jgi:hypothetical protein